MPEARVTSAKEAVPFTAALWLAEFVGLGRLWAVEGEGKRLATTITATNAADAKRN
jgi:hypothetical protein